MTSTIGAHLTIDLDKNDCCVDRKHALKCCLGKKKSSPKLLVRDGFARLYLFITEQGETNPKKIKNLSQQLRTSLGLGHGVCVCPDPSGERLIRNAFAHKYLKFQMQTQSKHAQKHSGTRPMQRPTLMYACVRARARTWPRPLVPLTAGGRVCAAAASSVPLYPGCFCEAREPDSARRYIPVGTRGPSAA